MAYSSELSVDDLKHKLDAVVADLKCSEAMRRDMGLVGLSECIEMVISLTDRGPEDLKHSQATLDNAVSTLIRLLEDSNPRVIAEVISLLNKGFTECRRFNNYVDTFVNLLLSLLNARDSDVSFQAHYGLDKITKTSTNLEIVSILVTFYDRHHDYTFQVAEYLSNIVEHCPLSDLGNCPYDVVPDFQKFLTETLMESDKAVVSQAGRLYSLLIGKYNPKLNLPDKQKKKAEKIRKKNKPKTKDKKKPVVDNSNPVSFSEDLFSVKQTPVQSQLHSESAAKALGLDLSQAHDACAITRRRVFDEIRLRLDSSLVREQVLSNKPAMDALFDALVARVGDEDSRTQKFVLGSLNLLLSDRMPETNFRSLVEAIVQLVPVLPHKKAERLTSLMGLVVSVYFSADPRYFITKALDKKFQDMFGDCCSLIHEHMVRFKSTRLRFVQGGGVSFLVQHLPRSVCMQFTEEILQAVLDCGIDSCHLDALLKMLESDSADLRQSCLRILCGAAQGLTFYNVECGNYLDNPTEYFILDANNYLEVPKVKGLKEFTLMFWFLQTVPMEREVLLNIENSSESFHVVIRSSQLFLEFKNKKSEYIELAVGQWNSCVLSFKLCHQYFSKKGEYTLYSNGRSFKIQVTQRQPPSRLLVGNDLSAHSKKPFEGHVSTLTLLTKHLSRSQISSRMSSGVDSLHLTSKLSNRSLLRTEDADVFYRILPSDSSIRCNKISVPSLPHALRSLGGFHRLLELLESVPEVEELMELIVSLSYSRFFESMHMPHFFEYVGRVLAASPFYVPGSRLLGQIQRLLDTANPECEQAILRGILFNRHLWSKIDKADIETYGKTIKQNMSRLHGLTLGYLFNILCLVVHPQGHSKSMVNLIVSLLQKENKGHRLGDSLIDLLYKIQHRENFAAVYQQLLEEPALVKLSFTIQQKRKAVALLGSATDEMIEKNVLKLCWPNRPEAEDPTMNQLVDEIDGALSPTELRMKSFTFLIGKAAKNFPEAFRLITRRLHTSSALPEFLKIVAEIAKSDSEFARVALTTDAPRWINEVFVTHYGSDDGIAQLVFGLLAACVKSLKKDEALAVMSIRKFTHGVGRPAAGLKALLELMTYLLDEVREEFIERKHIFVAVLGICEDFLVELRCAYLAENIEAFISFLTRVLDLGLALNLNLCSEPPVPYVRINALYSPEKSFTTSSEEKVFVKEGGFIRIVLRLHLMGLSYCQSPILLDNMTKLLGGRNFMNAMTPQMKLNWQSQFMDFRGALQAEVPEVDIFFDTQRVCAYVLTESIEILLRQISDHDSVDLNSIPLVGFLEKMLKEAEFFRSEFFRKTIGTENELRELEELLKSDYQFQSTLFIRSDIFRTVLSARRQEPATVESLERAFRQEVDTVCQKLVSCDRDFSRIMQCLLKQSDYLKYVHLYFLATICGKLNYIERAARPNIRNAGCVILEPKTPMSMIPAVFEEETEDLKLYELCIQQSYYRYWKRAKAFPSHAPVHELQQMRNVFDFQGRRTLLKPKDMKPEQRYSLLEVVSSELDEEFGASFRPEPSENLSNVNELVRPSTNTLILDCELIKVEANFIGVVKLTKQYLIYSSDGLQLTPKSCYKNVAPQCARVKRQSTHIFSITEISKVLPRRYMHQFTAAEVLFISGKSWLLNFFTPEAFDRFHKNLSRSVRFPRYPEWLARGDKLLRGWQDEKLTNFQFLLQLNNLASRSFHDLTQYPVFPWVITDFMSPSLNYDNPNSYRNLEFPVGAQTSQLRTEVANRFQTWIVDAMDDMDAFHYGSHYSSCGTVLHYLVRLEPFCTQAIKLQGTGELDKAERLFSSLQTAWNSTQLQLGDVKEVVPELFYCVEVFENRTGKPLGCKQTGSFVEGVALPVWAKNPFDCVMKHMRAFEYQQVSFKLRSWVDLVFGFKQQGEAAIKAFNVFSELSYQVKYVKKLERAPSDQLEWMISNIFDFGQTPVQVFGREVQVMPRMDSDKHFYIPFEENISCLSYTGCVLNLQKIHREVYLITLKRTDLALVKYDAASRKGKEIVLNNTRLTEDTRGQVSSCPIASISCFYRDEFIVSGGHYDNSFRLHRLNGSLVHAVYYHSSRVITVTASATFFFTGGQDFLVARWEVREDAVQCLTGYRGHASAVLAVAPLESFCVVASYSQQGLVLIHELRTAECLRRFDFGVITGLLASEYGFFVATYGKVVSVFNANGTQTDWEPLLHGLQICGAQGIFGCEHLLVRTESTLEICKLFEPQPCHVFQASASDRAHWFCLDKSHYLLLACT